jgi:hypothetical protein
MKISDLLKLGYHIEFGQEPLARRFIDKTRDEKSYYLILSKKFFKSKKIIAPEYLDRSEYLKTIIQGAFNEIEERIACNREYLL